MGLAQQKLLAICSPSNFTHSQDELGGKTWIYFGHLPLLYDSYMCSVRDLCSGGCPKQIEQPLPYNSAKYSVTNGGATIQKLGDFDIDTNPGRRPKWGSFSGQLGKDRFHDEPLPASLRCTTNLVVAAFKSLSYTL